MSRTATTPARSEISERLGRIDWKAAEESLWARGYAQMPVLLSPEECDELVTLYPDEKRFRSRIQMERYRFGAGDYKYFDHPLPEAVRNLRTQIYPHLAKIANAWAQALGDDQQPYPLEHEAFLEICHAAGQKRPTPLLLHYEAGGYNCLHQDIYGEVAFPMQMVLMLGQAGRDWEGGEFVLIEQQPRAQSRAEVLQADQGAAIVFTTRYRPVKGTRGFYRVNLKHGVSRVRSGTRYTLGVIFHDAK